MNFLKKIRKNRINIGKELNKLLILIKKFPQKYKLSTITKNLQSIIKT